MLVIESISHGVLRRIIDCHAERKDFAALNADERASSSVWRWQHSATSRVSARRTRWPKHCSDFGERTLVNAIAHAG